MVTHLKILLFLHYIIGKEGKMSKNTSFSKQKLAAFYSKQLLDSKIKRNKPPQTYIDARYLI